MATKKKTTHSPKFEMVKNYYNRGLWNKQMVKNAVVNPKDNPWITAEEYEEITGEPYVADEE